MATPTPFPLHSQRSHNQGRIQDLKKGVLSVRAQSAWEKFGGATSVTPLSLKHVKSKNQDKIKIGEKRLRVSCFGWPPITRSRT